MRRVDQKENRSPERTDNGINLFLLLLSQGREAEGEIPTLPLCGCGWACEFLPSRSSWGHGFAIFTGRERRAVPERISRNGSLYH